MYDQQTMTSQECPRCGLIHPSYPPCTVDLNFLNKQKQEAEQRAKIIESNTLSQLNMNDGIVTLNAKPISYDEDGNQILTAIPTNNNSPVPFDNPVDISVTPKPKTYEYETSSHRPYNDVRQYIEESDTEKLINQTRSVINAYVNTKHVNEKAFCQYVLVEISKVISKFDDKYVPQDKIIEYDNIPSININKEESYVESVLKDYEIKAKDEILDDEVTDVDDIDEFVKKIEDL